MSAPRCCNYPMAPDPRTDFWHCLLCGADASEEQLALTKVLRELYYRGTYIRSTDDLSNPKEET